MLRLLLKLDETRSVSAAGAALGLSQPASSNALARLRQALGDPLFVRTREGMTPTRFAAEIIPSINEHVAGITAALSQQDEFDPATSIQTFRLSLSGLGEAIFLPKLSKRIFQVAPNVRLFNIEASLPDTFSVLERREADVAIGILDIKGRGLRSRTLYEESYCAIVGTDTSYDFDVPAKLSEARIVLVATSAVFAQNIEETLSRSGLNDNITLRLRYVGALPDLLNVLNVVAIVPSQYAQNLSQTGQARILPISIPLGNYEVNMVWHEITTKDPGCKWLRAQVEDLFGASKNNGARL